MFLVLLVVVVPTINPHFEGTFPVALFSSNGEKMGRCFVKKMAPFLHGTHRLAAMFIRCYRLFILLLRWLVALKRENPFVDPSSQIVWLVWSGFVSLVGWFVGYPPGALHFPVAGTGNRAVTPRRVAVRVLGALSVDGWRLQRVTVDFLEGQGWLGSHRLMAVSYNVYIYINALRVDNWRKSQRTYVIFDM